MPLWSPFWREGEEPGRHAAVQRCPGPICRSALKDELFFTVIDPFAAITYPPDLPVSARREEIVAALRRHQVVIVAGETGSGKTTQLPKMCVEAGLAQQGQIGCTQPRRVAAMSVSRRVAEEIGVPWGREVGCKMRFNDDTSRETRIKFMTDGILLAEIQSDPELRAYSALILDEAHERSLNIDFLLGYLQGLLGRRPDLKLIITSATIDTEAFSRAFGGAPVIEISGRLFPVEIRYVDPLELGPGGAETGDPLSHVEAATRIAEEILIERDSGDILVFLPTERDIREAQELLEASLGNGIDVLPLYGRMASTAQQRIFAPGANRRVVLATNVAETSLTIPRIGAVIDTGLARISRYNPRTRTKRLPVEPVSQSSANQRAGRAGRVQEGLCIRLFAEDDFEKRPRFTQPEIQRANLAEVILRMKAFRLGEVEVFPFINPPLPQAIRSGYQLLEELGALRENQEAAQPCDRWQLTPMGRELARLPLDPTLARMLLQAREEGVLEEILVIAAGLSIPDPRERPDDEKEAAAAAHKLLAHPGSDFMGLLNIWNAAPAPTAGSGPVRTSRNALRRFCKSHYLSLTRMREWRDIHRQLAEAMRSLPYRGKAQAHPQRPRNEDELYRAIHRAILAGLLGQIGQRQERNSYKASGNRLLTLFPGSSLYNRKAKPKPKGSREPQKPHKPEKENTTSPEWIVSAEIVQTSQLFARTVAGIDPQWVVDLGPHLCQFRHTHPGWSARAGRVLVTERVLIHGLELARRQIDHGRINPEEATELFIRGALLADSEDPFEAELPESNNPMDELAALQGGLYRRPSPAEKRRPAINHRFFKANETLREKIETTLTKLRHGRIHDLNEAFYHFYAARIRNISSLHDLDKLVRREITRDPTFLHANESDLLQDELACDHEAFPDQVALGNSILPLRYAYTPGEESDGITVRVPLPLAGKLTTGRLHWMVPGLRVEQAAALLRNLPKATRKQLQPLEPKIAEIAAHFDPGDADLFATLSRFIHERYRILVPVGEWQPLPDHLRPRVEIVDRRNRALATGRDLDQVQAQVDQADLRSRNWDRLSHQWTQRNLTAWPTRLPYTAPGDAPTTLPEHIIIERVGGEPLLGYPGFLLEHDNSVSLHLFRKKEDLLAAAPAAIHRLAELHLPKEKEWLLNEFRTLGQNTAAPSPEKAAKALSNAGGLKSLQSLSSLGSLSNLKPGPATVTAALPGSLSAFCPEAAARHVTLPLLRLHPLLPLSRERFEVMLDAAQKAISLQAQRLREQTAAILTQRNALLASRHRYPGIDRDIERLVAADFLERTPPEQLQHLPRYLKAIGRRAERAAMNPAKDAEKARQLDAFKGWHDRLSPKKRETFRWLMEEYRVSLFAQELGTAQPVSAQRLQAFMQGGV